MKNRVKALVSMNYSEIMNEQMLQPLIECERINEIYLIHDLMIPKLPKIKSYKLKFLSPSGKITIKYTIGALIKQILMIYLTIAKRPDIVMGFYNFPHPVYAFICGKIFRKRTFAYIDDWPGIWRLKRILIPILKHFDIIATTGTQTMEFLAKEGINKDKLFVLPDSINIERFRPLPLPKQYDIISVGRLAPAKNFETLLKTVAKIKEFKNDIKVGIAGDGSLKKSLEDLTNQLGVTENVEFLGYKNNPEFYYNSTRIFILTSIWEGMPMAMLEAMSCGIPCIVSNVGDVTDAAIDGVNAIVIDNPYNVKGFANATIKLLNDDEFYKKLSENTKIVREKYSYESATTVWDEILDSIKN